MGMASALAAVVILILISWVGVQGLKLTAVFGVLVPYTAIAIFFVGVLARIIQWARIPNPFRIPTTGGQQKGLDWAPQSRMDNPYTTGQVIIRMLSEIFLFRSLFRNLSPRMGTEGSGVTYASAKWLWLFAILFHYAMLTTLFRHVRFFTSPVPWPVRIIEAVDGWLEVGVPEVMVSGVLVLMGLSLLLARRLAIPRLRYISLLNDYFPLFLLMAIATTGILMRYVTGIDVTSVKQLAMGLVSFRPGPTEGIGPLFFIHLFLVSTLLAYFPFSKLMHAVGIFFSPTRDMPNNNRAVHHDNPWNYSVKFHAYADYEAEFRDKMVEAGIPLDGPDAPSREKESDRAG